MFDGLPKRDRYEEASGTLYTVILDYRGGTYISQVMAKSAQAAVLAWAQSLDCSQIKYLGERRKQALIKAIEDDPYKANHLVELEGLTNAWCCGVLGFSGLINVVKTDRR